MLQLSKVRKSYTTADFTQVALDDVSIAFRDNEFVAVLGPSGSGKTTMLNIIGGLDHYDSGDLIIDGISTKQYKDRDWDTYRNNRIGFVFQSYNLIPHQTVLANVELALTLSGVSPGERKERAAAALEEVGLGDHIHKRPSQLSGGQMQRVAIARALINDPEILLADEPTGALDSKTSTQIMNLLTEIAHDRLVVMVTHNPELAERYANRIVNLRDGMVVDDTNPFDPTTEDLRLSDKTVKKTSMSFFTAIALSFNNLMTKKGRTLMTSFAGSIGIIGIAAILALATGVNNYIKSIEEDTLSVYPLTIQNQGLDMTAMLAMSPDMSSSSDADSAGSGSDLHEIQMMTKMFSSIGSNDLAALKKYLDADGGNIDDYVNSIEYSYNVTPQIFSPDTTDGVRQVNPDQTFAALGFGPGSTSNPMMSASMSTNIFRQMMGDTTLVEGQYDLVKGRWPTAADELLVVLTENGGISDYVLFTIGLRDPAELDRMVQQLIDEQEVVVPEGERLDLSYDDIMGVSFKLVDAADFYTYDQTYNVWTDKRNDTAFMRNLVNDGEELHITGIVQPKNGAAAALMPGIYFTPELTADLISQSARTEIVKRQLAEPDINVFSGRSFTDEAENPTNSEFDMSSLMSIDESKLAAAFTFDESALSMDLSGLSLDFSGLNLDTSAMDLDLTNMQIDTSALPEMDLMGIVGQLDFNLGDVDTDLAREVAAGLIRGYLDYCTDNNVDPIDVRTNLPAFIDTDTGQELVEQAGGIIDLSDLQEQLQTILGDYMQQVMATFMGQISDQFGTVLQDEIGTAITIQLSTALESSMNQLVSNMSNAMGIDEQAFMDAFQFNMNEEDLAQLMMAMMTTGQTSFEGNLQKLGYADFAKPSNIDIYPKDFESKAQVITVLDNYNAQMKADGDEEKVITYTDFVGALMSSVTDIINTISYVLIAFVAISLVVSSIMIGVITYISVLERKKEIGILRSIGASKRDIRRVFNAETLIVGFVAGAVGIAVTVLLTIPTNIIVKSRFNITNVAHLPWQAAIVLVAISMGLTFLAGLIPSSAASRRDPVETLRSE